MPEKTEENSMCNVKRFLFVALLVGCVVFLPAVGLAQYRGSLHGTVTDPQGGVMPGATVTLTDPSIHKQWETTTDDSGIYYFNALAPSTYQLTVEMPGFKKKILENIHLIPEQANDVDVQLELGEVHTTITVMEATPPIDTANANISGTITRSQIQSMPSFGRDVFKLVQLAPGVFGDNSLAAGGGGFNLPGTQGPGATGGNTGIFQTENGPQALAAGQQYENNSYSIDGVNTTSAVWGGTTVITPSEESVQSVKILTNLYDAEYGRYSGAHVQVTTNRGTDNYHGSLFVTGHRPGLNAYQRFNGLGNAVVRDDNYFTQFGGSVGGPMWKGKLYAFFSYETTRSPKAQVNFANGWYENPALASQVSSGSLAAQYLKFPGAAVQAVRMNNSTCANAGLTEGVNCVTIPGQGLDIGSPLKTGLGTQDLTWTSPSNPGIGGGLDGVADIANYLTQSTSTRSAAQYNGRVDANVTNKDHLTYSMYWVPQDSSFLNGPARGYNLFFHNQVNNSFTAIWNRANSPTFLNELRANAAGWRWNEVTSNPQSPVGLPSDNIGQTGSITLSKFGPNVGSIFDQWTYAVRDVATKIVGRHTIKFGGEVTRMLYLNEAPYATAPSYNFFNLWDFLNDAPQSESGRFNPNTGVPTLARQDDRENIWGFFVQDNFQLKKNLMLNLGLRWSYFGPLSAKLNNMFVAVPGSGADFMTGLNVVKGNDLSHLNAWNAQKNNFSPEIGFAWSPSGLKDKLVIRGGYGLNYNQFEIALSGNVSNNPGLVVNPTFTMSSPTSPNPGIVYAVSADLHSLTSFPSNPHAVSSFGSNGLPSNGAPVNVVLFPTDFQTLRVHHYSLQAEYDLGHKYVLSLGYEGSLSRHLVFHQNPNATPAATGLTLNPQIGGGDFWDMNGYGNYNAMITHFRHQFSGSFTADAQFTWSHSLDTASGPYYENPFPYSPSLNYGPSDFNVGKALKMFAVWQPPIFKGNSWVGKVAGGWIITGIFNVHSGFPWSPVTSVQGGSLYCGTCGYGVLYPAAYLGGAGTSTSTDQFKTGANYPKGGSAYFSVPSYTAFSGSNYGNALPQTGIGRNPLVGPRYKSLDFSLVKAFGLPNAPVLGEKARIEIRLDAYNIFNNLNLNPSSISNNIASTNFGQATSALSGRVVTLGARFNF
jgi:hypothetical protein